MADRPSHIQHLLMVDAHFTWWVKGRSYLCRIIDMLHMGYVDEVLFGKEVASRMPDIAKQWVAEYRRLKAYSSCAPHLRRILAPGGWSVPDGFGSA